MSVLLTTQTTLPEETLSALRDAVDVATASLVERGGSPYHFTYWYELGTPARNPVEQVVPHLRAHIPEAVRDRAVGVEYWLGRTTPPYSDNFEFGLHKDFGENPETGALESPLMSSILYLTTVQDGPLIVFPAEPNLADPAKEHVFPEANLFARFPGNLWHTVGSRQDVLPAGAAAADNGSAARLTVLVNWWSYRPSSEVSEPMKLIAADFDGAVYPSLATG